MCMRCNGMSEETVMESYRQTIQTHGWVVIAVQGDGDEAAFAYTLGLTRFHGHPEMLVSGLDQSVAGVLLNDFGAEVRLGIDFVAGQRGFGLDQRRLQLVQVDEPAVLVEAQKLYASEAGLVPALQVVYTDAMGRWPWELSGRGGPRPAQSLFGRPIHR